MKRKVLGRGLEALIPELERVEAASNEIDIDRITPNPDQPRFKLEDRNIDELATSIRENGILQPILVRPMGDGYQLIAGERRLAAAQRAGMLKIPAVVREVPDNRLLELALVENIQREQLNPMEEAQAYQNLLDTLAMTQEELAARLGRERSTLANSLRLLKLPPPVKLLVAEGKLSPGHARALLSSNASPSELTKVAQTIVDQAWSVRDAERWAQKQTKRTRTQRPQDPNVTAALEHLRLLLGTKVDIVGGRDAKGTGHLRIHFYSHEDLARIYAVFLGKKS